MNEYIKRIKTDRVIFWSSMGTVLFFICSVAALIISYHNLPPLVPVFNQLPWGTQRLGEAYKIVIPLGLIFILFIINGIFSYSLHDKLPLISRILYITSFLISLLTCIFIIKTVLLIV